MSDIPGQYVHPSTKQCNYVGLTCKSYYITAGSADTTYYLSYDANPLFKVVIITMQSRPSGSSIYSANTYVTFPIDNVITEAYIDCKFVKSTPLTHDVTEVRFSSYNGECDITWTKTSTILYRATMDVYCYYI